MFNGLLSFSAFLVSDDAFILTLVVASSTTHALSIAVRNFAIRTGVGLQISAVATPLAAAFLYKGGPFPLLIPMLLAPLSMFHIRVRLKIARNPAQRNRIP